MGHKAHPVGLRLGIHRKWKSNWFFESKNYTKFIHLNLTIEKFFKGFFYFFKTRKSLLLKCQVFKIATNQLFIILFYYRFRKKLKRSIKKKNNIKKFENWKLQLEKFLLRNRKKIYNNNLNFLNQKVLKNFSIKFISQIQNVNQITFPKTLILQQKKNLFLTKIFLLKKIKMYLYQINYILNTNLINKITLEKIQQIFKKILILKLIFKSNKYLSNQNLKNIYNFIQIYSLTIFSKNILKKKILKFFFKNFFTITKILHYNIKTNVKKKNKVKYIQFIYNKLILKKLKKKYLKTKKSFKKKSLLIKNKKTSTWTLFLKKKPKFINSKLNNQQKTKLLKIYHPITKIKKFLSKITNLKINLIFINALSFAKFFYFINENPKKNKKEKFNVFKVQQTMLNKYKYNAIFIKDFVYLAFLSVLYKNPIFLVNFIGEQFKRLPKNRKQLKLLNFINQTLKIFCRQRSEILGFKLQIKGRLNRRNRTNKWVFSRGILPIQTYNTRVEYGYSEGFTRRGLIGIKIWFFYKRLFKKILKKKLLQYLYYSKYKKNFYKTTKVFFKRKNFKQSFIKKNFLLNKHVKT